MRWCLQGLLRGWHRDGAFGVMWWGFSIIRKNAASGVRQFGLNSAWSLACWSFWMISFTSVLICRLKILIFTSFVVRIRWRASHVVYCVSCEGCLVVLLSSSRCCHHCARHCPWPWVKGRWWELLLLTPTQVSALAFTLSSSNLDLLMHLCVYASNI